MFSCQQPCPNNPEVFTRYSPDSRQYRQELKRYMEHSPDLQFWIKDYHNSDSQEYLEISIQGVDSCASTTMLVQDWSKLDGVRQTKAMSWSGAEMKGLKYQFASLQDKPVLVYLSHDHILD